MGRLEVPFKFRRGCASLNPIHIVVRPSRVRVEPNDTFLSSTTRQNQEEQYTHIMVIMEVLDMTTSQSWL